MTSQRFIIEGVPGSGKSSIFGSALRAAPNCLAFPEINPTRAVARYLSNLGSVARAGWYLDRAAAQLRAAEEASKLFPLTISDKGPLSVLAFSYAFDGRKSAAYRAIEQTYRDANFHHCSDERVLIMLTTVEVSLARRAQKRETKAASPWYDPEFLECQLEFFRNVAPALHERANVIDTSELAREDTFGTIGGLLGVELQEETAPPPDARDQRFYPMTGYRIDDDAIWAFFSQEGGSNYIGQPITGLEKHHDHQIQFFERGALERKEEGVGHWDAVKWVEGRCP